MILTVFDLINNCEVDNLWLSITDYKNNIIMDGDLHSVIDMFRLTLQMLTVKRWNIIQVYSETKDNILILEVVINEHIS